MSISDVVVGVLRGDNQVGCLTKEDVWYPRWYSGAKTATYGSVEELVNAVNARKVTYGLLPEAMIAQHLKDVRVLEKPRVVQEVGGSREWTDYALIAMGERHYKPSYLKG